MHVDPECWPVAHARDPSDLMNGGKWVTTADITDLGQSKREREGTASGRRLTGAITCCQRAAHGIQSCCRTVKCEGQRFDEMQLKGTIYCNDNRHVVDLTFHNSSRPLFFFFEESATNFINSFCQALELRMAANGPLAVLNDAVRLCFNIQMSYQTHMKHRKTLW